MPFAELRAFSRKEAKLLASLIPVPLAELGVAQPAQRKTVCVAGKLSSLYYSTRSIPLGSKYKKARSLSGVLLYWEPGGVLLSHGICHTTIVAAAFHF
jgi:hypothetical protein